MKLDEAKLNKLLKSADTPNLFLLYGKEIFLIKTYFDKIMSKYSADKGDAFNFKKFEGCPDISDISDALESLPVFAERRLVIFNDLDFEKYDAGNISVLINLFSDIPSTTVAVLTYTGISADIKKAKTKKLFAVIEKNGIISEFNYLTPTKIAGLIVKKSARAGVRISDENARYIAELCLCDLTLISGEIDKLCAYVESGGEIARQDIDILVTRQLDIGVFELAGAITANNMTGAFGILRDLFDSGYASVVILSALAGVFLDYYAVKLGSTANPGKSASVIAEDFLFKNRAWIIEKTIRSIKNISLGYIKKCLDILYEADFQLKSSPVSDEIIIEKTLARLAEAKC